MSDSEDILLQSIVTESQLTRKQIADVEDYTREKFSDIEKRMLTKDDFRDFSDILDKKFDSYDKVDKKNDDEIIKVNEKIETLVGVNNLNTAFRVKLEKCWHLFLEKAIWIAGTATAAFMAGYFLHKYVK